MNVISRACHSMIKGRKQILNALIIGIFGFATSVAVAIPLDKVDYDLVISEDNYPLLFAKKNKYGFSEKLSQSELNSLQDCNSSSGCSSEAVQKGAKKYFMSSAGNYGLATAYYNSQGKLVGTHLGGIDSSIDTIPPVITITGANPLSLQRGSSYTEFGATAQDDVDGTVTAVPSGSVNSNTVGTYSITYTAVDTAGNTSTEDRTINVTEEDDTTAPVITINGSNPINVVRGSIYTDAGATAVDDRDGSQVITGTGSVNTSNVGDYYIYYNFSDTAGNSATTKIRRVNVIAQTNTDTTPPLISIIGSSSVTIQKGTPYSDLGATATDDRDGSVQVGTNHSVNVNIVGTYTVTYTATDLAGNSSTAIRTVQVFDNTPPTIPSASILPSANAIARISEDSSSNPVGYLDGEFSVSATGAATYNISIAIPPGTAGVKPNIGLSYNSQSGVGIAGLGWSISGLSSISRCSKIKARDYQIVGIEMNETDVYCLDGQRLIQVWYNPNATNGNTLRKFKLEIDDFSEIEQIKRTSGNYFVVKTKSGEINTYGFTDDSSMDLDYLPYVPSNTKRISFLINQTKDVMGNYINYIYVDNIGAFDGRIKKVEYTGNSNTGLTPYHSVNFTYTGSTEPYYGYVLGAAKKAVPRLTNISVKYGANTFREYKLGYLNVNNYNNKLDKLESIQECVGTKCLPATVFKWNGYYQSLDSEANSSFANTKNLSRLYNPNLLESVPFDFGGKLFTPNTTTNGNYFSWSSNANTGYHPEYSQKLFGDVDGDGLTDIVGVNFKPGSTRCNFSGDGVCLEVATSTGKNFHYPKATLGLAESNGDPRTSPFYLADANGDGLADLVNLNPFGKIIVYLSNGSKFSAGQIWRSPAQNLPHEYDLDKSPVFVQDVSGDGKADIVRFLGNGVSVSHSTGSSYQNRFLSSNYFGASFSNIDTSLYRQNYSDENVSVQLIDVSADGLPDIVVHNASGTMVAINRVLSTSDGIYKAKFDAQLDDQTGDPIVAGNPSLNTPTNRNTPRLMGDVNADGYPDIVGFFENAVYVAYGIGKNSTKKLFEPYEYAFNSWTTNTGWNYSKKPLYLIDVNADGRSDIAAFGDSGVSVRLANQFGFTASATQWTSSFGSSSWNSTNDIRSFTDMNGDGLPDVIGINEQGIEVGINKAKQQRISQIIIGGEVSNTNSIGMNRSIDVEYEKLTAPRSYSVYTKSADVNALQAPMFVVSAHFSSNGNSSTSASSRNRKIGMLYQYEGLVVDRTNGRGALGFKKRTAKDLSTNIYSVITYHQVFPLTGRVQSEETRVPITPTSSLTKIISEKEITTKYKKPSNFYNYYKVYTEKEDETFYNFYGSVAFQQDISTYSEPSSCGNITTTKVTNYDLVRNERYSKETIASYPGGSDCFKQSRLSSARVYTQRNGTDQKSRYSTFTYTTKGQIKTEIIEPQQTNKLTTTYVYDLYGNVVSTTVSGGFQTRTTSTGYDPKGRFATSITNAIGQTETRQYDQKLGVLNRVIDINSLTTNIYYNDFAQKYLTIAPNNSYIHTTYMWSGVPIGNSFARYYTDTRTSVNGSLSRKFYDQLDRVIRTVDIGLDGQSSIVDKQYDPKTAELQKESLPYLIGATPQWITYTYDELGRISTTKKPGLNKVRIGYDGLKTFTIDQYSNTKTHINNVLGKPLKVTDDLGNEIRYTYYSDGNLKQVTNNASFGTGTTQDNPSSSSISTLFEYDVFGNKIKMTDPDMGIWDYTYYPTGELKTQTDAKGNQQTLYYDKLGRLITRSESVEGTTTWQYDIAVGKSKGKLARVTSKSHTKILSYNNLGQLALETVQIPNGVGSTNTTTYFTQSLYDGNGRLDIVKYPNPSSSSSAAIDVKYQYSYGGKLKSIKNNQSNVKYWEANKSNAFGNITEQTFGSIVKRYKTYDTLGRIDRIISNKTNGSLLQSVDYDFDQVGNLIKRQNNFSGASETFLYDDLYRLKTTNTTYQNVTSSNLVRYDGHGSITRKNGKAYSYFANSERAVSRVGSDNYTYDANGNMTGGAGRTISWSSFNKPSNISRGTKSIQLLYDADRRRIYKETTDSSTNGINKKTWYVNGFFEREQITSGNNSGAETHKYYLKVGSQTIGYITQSISSTGSRSPNNTRYLLTDHLGSVDVITKADGNIAQTLSFDSWGNRRQGSWNAASSSQLANILAGLNTEAMKMGFTGHEHDDEIGLVNMKGRLYDAEIGRFISADPHIQFVTDTQSYNRYTYVRNNPLSITDPTGYFWGIGRWFKKQWKKWGRTIVAIAATIITGGWAAGAFGSAIVGGAVGGFVGGAISTGTIQGALRGAVFGGITAGVAAGAKAFSAAARFGRFGQSVVHGVAQGTVSVLRGGKFGSGLVSGFASHVAAPLIRGANKYVRTAKAAVLGGTVSKLVGGKFANGAVTGAFVHLFNHESRKPYLDKRITVGKKGAGITNAGYRTKLSWGDRIRNFSWSKVFTKVTSLGFLKVDTIKGALAFNPVSTGVFAVMYMSPVGDGPNFISNNNFVGPHLPSTFETPSYQGELTLWE